MPVRHAAAHWTGDLKAGSGTVTVNSGAVTAPYSAGSRFENAAGTNPEELLGAAHAACYAMQLTALLSLAGHAPKSVAATADVHIDPVAGGFAISKILLSVVGDVPGISAADFTAQAEKAKEICPVSKALAAVPMELTVTFAG
jgi:osmotically inducible protein OsmC